MAFHVVVQPYTLENENILWKFRATYPLKGGCIRLDHAASSRRRRPPELVAQQAFHVEATSKVLYRCGSFDSLFCRRKWC